MVYQKLKFSLISLSLLGLTAFPAIAHEENDEENKETINKQEEEHHHTEDKDFTRAFKEGTLNIISPFTFKKDMMYILYSHNFFQGSFPRSSNPAFHFSYTPISHLQVDTILSLRESPLEWEIGLKYQIMDEFEGAPISLTPRISYNTRGNIFGLDISATKIFMKDILQLGLGYRLLSSDPKDFSDTAGKVPLNGIVQGIGLNTILRVYKQWHIFGDVVLPFDSNLISNKGFIWSAGIKKRLPSTPHILTLYAGNSNESTLSGRTVSTGNGKYPDMLKVGFNFSIGIGNASKFPEKLF